MLEIFFLLFLLFLFALVVGSYCRTAAFSRIDNELSLAFDLPLAFKGLEEGKKLGAGTVIERTVSFMNRTDSIFCAQQVVANDMQYFGSRHPFDFDPKDFIERFDAFSESGQVEVRLVRYFYKGEYAVIEMLWIVFPRYSSFLEDVAPQILPLLLNHTEFENIRPSACHVRRECNGIMTELAFYVSEKRHPLQVSVSFYSHARMREIVRQEKREEKR